MGIIYRVCDGLLALLPAEEGGRRVFAETLADWRREPRTLRGLAAVARAVAGVSAKELASLSMCRTWLHIAAWSTAWAILGIGLSRIAYGWTYRPAYDLAAWSVVGVVFFLPTAILLSSITRRRPVPALGLVFASAVVGLLLVGWALPAANRVTFGPVDMFTLGGSGVAKSAESGGAQIFQMILPRLSLEHVSGQFAHHLPGRVAAGPPNGWPAIQLISFSAAFVCLCALVPLIGAALRQRHTLSRRAAITFALLFLMYRGQIADFVAPDWVLWSFVAPWLLVSVLAGAYLIIVRSAFSATSSTAADPTVK
jgi:hypothetical protein